MRARVVRHPSRQRGRHIDHRPHRARIDVGRIGQRVERNRGAVLHGGAADCPGDDWRVVDTRDLHRHRGPAQGAIAEPDRIRESVGQVLTWVQCLNLQLECSAERACVVADLAVSGDLDRGAVETSICDPGHVLDQQVGSGNTVVFKAVVDGIKRLRIPAEVVGHHIEGVRLGVVVVLRQKVRVVLRLRRVVERRGADGHDVSLLRVGSGGSTRRHMGAECSERHPLGHPPRARCSSRGAAARGSHA